MTAFVDWAEPLLLARKKLATAEACATLQLWTEAKDALYACRQLIDALQSAFIMQESEYTRLKYERGGWVLHRLNDHDAVTKPGVCPYCGGKDGQHADICAMWAVA